VELTMLPILILLAQELPQVVSVASEVNTVVNGAKAAGSAYAAVKAEYPKVADLIDKIGAMLPNPSGSPAHLDFVTESLFGDDLTAYLAANGNGAINLEQVRDAQA
jgi:hypothetical protein